MKLLSWSIKEKKQRWIAKQSDPIFHGQTNTNHRQPIKLLNQVDRIQLYLWYHMFLYSNQSILRDFKGRGVKGSIDVKGVDIKDGGEKGSGITAEEFVIDAEFLGKYL